MVKIIKSIIARKPEDLVKLKYKTGIIFGRNIRPIQDIMKLIFVMSFLKIIFIQH